MYKYLLFDLDDTVLDFKANELRSLKELFNENNIALTDEILNHYLEVNTRLWSEYESGLIKMDEVLNKRFEIVLNDFNYQIDGVKWEKMYRNNLGNGAELMEDAIDVLEKLSTKYTLYVVTNGVTKTQLNRLSKSNIEKYFKDIYTSENIGYPKPSSEFFNYVIDDIEGFDTNKALVIGDSLNNDVMGANNASMASCWMSNGRSNNTDIKPTYTINKLIDLLNIL